MMTRIRRRLHAGDLGRSPRVCLAALLLAAVFVLSNIGEGRAQELPAVPEPVAVPAAVAGTVVSQDITQNTTWTEAGSPYNVTQFVTVRAGVTLTVEPGVTVVVSPTSGFASPFQVKGTLLAQGTAGKPILFTGGRPQRGSWGGLLVGNTDQEPARATLDHVIVEYGQMLNANNRGNLELMAAIADVNNSIFRLGGAHGVSVAANSRLTLRNSSFIDNNNSAVLVAPGTLASDPELGGLSASGNGEFNAVVYSSVTLANAHRFEKSGLPYVFKGGFRAPWGSSLQIDAGVELRVDNGFTVEGSITAGGTAAEPVLFTGLKQEPGGWRGLDVRGTFEGVASARLDQVIIEFGGDANDANLVVDTANVTVTNTLLRNSLGDGLRNDGGDRDDSFAVSIANSSMTGNGKAAVACDDDMCSMTLASLSATGNGQNAVVQRDSIFRTGPWSNAGLPYLVEVSSGVFAGGKLQIEPGVEVRMAQGTSFSVAGELAAVGTPQQPVAFTGTQEQPGWWQGLLIAGNGTATLRHCAIGYGGGWGMPGNNGMIWVQTNNVFLSNCRVHNSQGAGILVNVDSEPLIVNNRIEENAVGLVAETRFKQLDVRNNWWGHASGPQHPANPNGQGQQIIGDNVLFDPWLTSPDGGGEAKGIFVQLSGPGRFSSGEEIVYSVLYYNNSGSPIQNAVLRFGMPGKAVLEEASPGGSFHAEYSQVFWKLGTLPDRAQGTVYAKVTYDRGLPDGLRNATAVQLSGTNLPAPLFNVQEYLDYAPRATLSSVELGSGEVDALRAASPELEALYQQALASGFKFGNAERQTLNTGQELVEVRLLRFNGGMDLLSLWLSNGKATGALVDGSSYTVLRSGKAVRYDLQSNAWSPVSFGAVQMAATNSGLTWGDCIQNCIEDKLPGYIIKKKISTLSDASKAVSCIASAGGDEGSYLGCAKIIGKLTKKLSPVSEGIDLGECNGNCQLCEEGGGNCDNPFCYCCTVDKYRCDSDDWLYGTFGIDVIKMKKCVVDDEEDMGKYLAETVVKVCALCEKCMYAGGGGSPACLVQPTNLAAVNTLATLLTLAAQQGAQDRLEIAAESDAECDECRAAKDPNELYGPAGDLLPGQLVTYEVAYENIGAGIAFDVFVANKLPEGVFDLSTLQIDGGGSYAAGAGTIFWEVGDLAPAGQPGASGRVSYSVRLRSDLPSGTVIANQAVVHFPSVPEETQTNRLIHLIKPLAAIPQALEVEAGQPLAITLGGRDAANTALAFTVVDEPLYGVLSGAAPNLVYTPHAGASGLDQFRFAASNGVSSAAANVSIRVLPSAADVTGPAVQWTAPADGAGIELAAPIAGTDATGTYYYPAVQAQFSEALDPASVSGSTVLVTDANGRQVPAAVQYDAAIDQVQLLLREEPQMGETYAVTIAGVRDLRGNVMASNYSWRFTIAAPGGQSGGRGLYLPVVAR